MDDLNRTNEDPTILGNDRPRTETSGDDRTLADRQLADRRADTNTGEEIGEAVGGISGVLTGAAIGSIGGPIGTIIGGIAGAVGGWWAGRAIADATTHVTHEDESYYRTHYESSSTRLADRSYEDARPAYQLGHLAGRNPDYQQRDFHEVEPELQRGWSKDVSARHGSWDQVRDYARHAFERGRGFGTGAVAGSAHTSTSETSQTRGASSLDGTSLGGSSQSTLGGASGATNTGSADRGGYVSPTAAEAGAAMSDASNVRAGGASAGASSTVGSDYGTPSSAATSSSSSSSSTSSSSLSGSGASGTSTSGYDALGKPRSATHETEVRSDASALGGKAENAWEKAKEGVENLGHRAANAIDDTKDRVDGNPASRPGPDSTDRPGRQF